MTRDVKFYRRLPYRRVVELHDGGGEAYFVARIQEIPFIQIDGATREEALYKLDQVFEDFIQSMLQYGDEIPEPDTWPGVEVDRSQQTSLLRQPIRSRPLGITPIVLQPDPVDPWTVAPSDAQTVGA